jgi:hypothetical protein
MTPAAPSSPGALPLDPLLAQLVGCLPAPHAAALRTACDAAEFHAEACWHSHDARPEAVVGLVRGAPERIAALAASLVPEHADRIARWLAATPGAEDVGFKLGHHGVQVYVRGALRAADAVAGLTAAGAAVQPTPIDNLLALFEQPDLAMVGLELHPDRVEGAVYASVARRPHTTAAVRDAFGFLVRVVAPDQLDAWDAAAPVLLDAPGDEIVYASMSASLDWPWAKLDVGARPLAIAAPLAAALGTGAVEPVLAAARGLGGGAWSHVGARFGSGFGPVFYPPVHGDRD